MIAIHYHRILRRSPPDNPHIGFRSVGPTQLFHHLKPSFIHLHRWPGLNLIEEHLDQGITLPRCLNRPIGKVHPGKLDPDPAELLLLTIERNRITELAHQHVGQKARRGDAFRDDLWGDRSNLYCLLAICAFTLPAGILGSNITDYLDLLGVDEGIRFEKRIGTMVNAGTN